jgi:murein DD-endopeptidase MepM/ murein hydrolase activator NlpD
VVALVFVLTALGGLFPLAVPGGQHRPQASAAALAMSLPGLPASAPTVSLTSIGSQPVPLTVIAPSVSQIAQTPSPSLAVTRASTTSGSGTSTVGRERDQIPIFYRYEVKQGDTVSSIAKRFGVGSDYIVWNNIDLQTNENLLRPGQLLQVPSVEGIIHAVRLGETLTEIAEHYDARVVDIINFPANNIPNANSLTENTTILVPGGRITPKPAPTLRPDPPALVNSSGGSGGGNAAAAVPASTGWVWPVKGMLTSNYGPSHPLGIDINAPFVPVAAAQGGVVVFAGGDRCCSYGLYIEVQHAGGYSTRYAHLSQFSVSLGQVVSQGQTVGVSGSTGASTGAHLHFEMRRNGQIVNPMSFLP